MAVNADSSFSPAAGNQKYCGFFFLQTGSDCTTGLVLCLDDVTRREGRSCSGGCCCCCASSVYWELIELRLESALSGSSSTCNPITASFCAVNILQLLELRAGKLFTQVKQKVRIEPDYKDFLFFFFFQMNWWMKVRFSSIVILFCCNMKHFTQNWLFPVQWMSIHCDHVEFHDLFPHWMIVSSELTRWCSAGVDVSPGFSPPPPHDSSGRLRSWRRNCWLLMWRTLSPVWPPFIQFPTFIGL